MSHKHKKRVPFLLEFQFWGSTKLSLCKPVELWDFFGPPFLRLHTLPTFPQRSARFPMEHHVNQLERDRRLICRHEIRTPLRIRVCKSNSPEHKAESLNLSEYGVYFATNSPLHEGEAGEVALRMPEEVIGEEADEWRCIGRGGRVERIESKLGKFGVGGRFACYEGAPAERPPVG